MEEELQVSSEVPVMKVLEKADSNTDSAKVTVSSVAFPSFVLYYVTCSI